MFLTPKYFFQAPFETPYVVRLHNVTVMAAPQPCFIFTHPNRGLWAIVVPLFVCLEKANIVYSDRSRICSVFFPLQLPELIIHG